LVFRFYGPEKAYFDQNFKLPDIEKKRRDETMTNQKSSTGNKAQETAWHRRRFIVPRRAG
jgi:hypothetical protein